MSESVEPGDTLNTKTQQQSLLDQPTKSDPSANTPSQILLEALQNFVTPLIHAAAGNNKKDIDQVYSTSLESGKLLSALQEFICSMIIQSRVGQPQGTKANLEAPNIGDIPENPTKTDSSGTEADGTCSDLIQDVNLGDFQLKVAYQSFIGKLKEAVREHVFCKMPIRLLHITNAPQNPGPRLQIMLLDRNAIYSRIMEEIQANFSESVFRERLESDLGQRLDYIYDEKRLKVEDNIIARLVQENTKYAILSHTWLRGYGEVTYGDWQTGQFDTRQPGYQKLANFCKAALKDHHISFGWMDTVCINKDSSSELDESIRSMYKWYNSSDVCITYLAETITLDNIHRDPWFTRGWTFQELLAPILVAFYSKDWQKFVQNTPYGDKHNPHILDQIFKATTITKEELCHSWRMPISRKMQLAARRKVTREEDVSYSLMGICDVSFSIAYGEGARRAFIRLMTEILNTSSSAQVVDIFNCAQKESSSVIPSAPSAYLHRSMVMQYTPPIEPLLLTHVGLRMPILLMPSLRVDDSCVENDHIGDYYAVLRLPALESWEAKNYHLLDKGIARSKSYDRWTFGILNFGGDTTNISVPGHCLAVCFKSQAQHQMHWDSTSSSLVIKRIDTKEPVVFHLKNRRNCTSGEGRSRYSIKRSELGKHGMSLTTMYL